MQEFLQNSKIDVNQFPTPKFLGTSYKYRSGHYFRQFVQKVDWSEIYQMDHKIAKIHYHSPHSEDLFSISAIHINLPNDSVPQSFKIVFPSPHGPQFVIFTWPYYFDLVNNMWYYWTHVGCLTEYRVFHCTFWLVICRVLVPPIHLEGKHIWKPPHWRQVKNFHTLNIHIYIHYNRWAQCREIHVWNFIWR